MFEQFGRLANFVKTIAHMWLSIVVNFAIGLVFSSYSYSCMLAIDSVCGSVSLRRSQMHKIEK